MTAKRFIILMFLASIWVRKFHCVFASLPPQNQSELERLFLVDFKRRLMEKLHMKSEPPSAGNLPAQIMDSVVGPRGFAGDEARPPTFVDDNKITDIVVAPFRTGFYKKTYICSFRVASKMRGSYEVASAKIWVHRRSASKSHWFQIYEIIGRKKRLIVNDTLSSYLPQWREFKFEPTWGWKRTPWKRLHIEIDGTSDQFNREVLSTNDKPPLLQLRMKPKKRRYRRSLSSPTSDDCKGDNRCCKHTMRLNLKQQMPFLLMPTHIEAMVCLGNCPILHRMRWPWTFISQQQKKRMSCCVPTKLSPLSVLYRNNAGNIVKTEVDNMVVESCGCA